MKIKHIFPKRLTYSSLKLLIVLTVTACFLLPMVWMVSTSLRTPGLPPSPSIEWLPRPLAFSNYYLIFQLLPLGRYALNSLLIALLAVPITLLIASLAGFATSLLAPRPRRLLIAFSIGLLIVPVTSLWLARFALFRWLGWIDTYLPLLAPALMGSSPFFILLFYWTFRQIPRELFESAVLDGAGPLTLWGRLAFPLARTTAVVVAVLAFIMYWNDFINPLLYLKSQRLYTLAIGLQQLQQMDSTNWPLLMAASVFTILPVFLLFFLLQRFFLQEDRLSGMFG